MISETVRREGVTRNHGRGSKALDLAPQWSGVCLTGEEVYSPELAKRYPDRDWILTRILWLSGCEPGRNRLGAVDSMRRYIYIHGTPDDQPMGVPRSHGCIRMRNGDIVELFDAVAAGTIVEIREGQA